MYQSHKLLLADKAIVQNGRRLTDKHMTFCQAVMKRQFPTIEGLACSLFQSKQHETKIKSGLQVIHLQNRSHWVLASNINSDNSHLNVYDSIFTSADEELLDVLSRLFDFETHTFLKFRSKLAALTVDYLLLQLHVLFYLVKIPAPAYLIKV